MSGKLLAVLTGLAVVVGVGGASPAVASCQSAYYCIPGPPVASTDGGVTASATSATLTGTVNPNGFETSYHFEYGQSVAALTSSSASGSAGSDFADHSVSATIGPLVACTTYFYRVVAQNDAGTGTGATLSFVTGGCYSGTGGIGAFVTTEPATGVTNAGATLNGTVNPGGRATNYQFEYGTTTAYGTQTTPQAAGSGSTTLPISATVNGLKPSTLYHYRAIALNSSGSGTGADRTFTTTANSTPATGQGAPVAGTSSAAGIGTTTATLVGTVNPQGAATQSSFAYGTTAAYGSVTPATTLQTRAVVTDTADHVVNTLLTGLKPGTTYHFQIVASNVFGTVRGSDRTFKTKKGTARLTLKTRPRRDRSAPYRYRASGRVKRPSSVSKSAGCKGKVRVTIRRAGRTVGAGTATVRSSCAYSKRVRVTKTLIGSGKLKVRASFRGNSRLRKATATARTVRYG